MEAQARKPYPTDVTDDEWAFVAPYLALLPETARQRRYEVREVFNALRWIVRAGAPWRLLPHELPPWPVVYQRTQRWLAVGCFEAIVHDLRAVLRLTIGRARSPRRWCWMAARCSPRSRAATAPATTGTSRPCSPRRDRRVGGAGVCGPGLHRGGAGRGGRDTRHPAGGPQTCRGEAGVCPPAPPVGRGTQLCLGRVLPPARPRLRAAAPDPGRLALRRLRLPHAHPLFLCPRTSPRP